MDFIDEKITNYCENHSTSESDVLKSLNRNTQANILAPRMISGHLQGRFLSMISKMIKPNYILEIGSFTGYSGICLSEGLQEEGKLITIDINDELNELVTTYFSKANILHKSEIISGDALTVIPNLDYKFDLVFIDADKKNYSNYYDLVFEKVNIGGFIIADNVLWSGNVIKEEKDWDTETINIIAFNEKVKNDIRVKKVMLPLRDGLLIIEKIQ